MSDLSVITVDAATMKYILVIENFTCGTLADGNDRRFVVDAYFEDGSVPNLGVFKDLEVACREARTAHQGQCITRVLMQWEPRP